MLQTRGKMCVHILWTKFNTNLLLLVTTTVISTLKKLTEKWSTSSEMTDFVLLLYSTGLKYSLLKTLPT